MFAVAVDLDSHNYHSPLNVVKSVINNSDFVSSLHFIYPNVQEKKPILYDGWQADCKQLEEELHIPVKFDAWLEAHNFKSEEIVVEVPPNVQLHLGDFETLKNRSKETKYHQTEFGIKTSLNLSSFSFFYGYLMILFIIQLFVSRFFNKKLYNNTDVRARYILTKGKGESFLPSKSSWSSYFTLSHVLPYVRANATISPSFRTSGFSFSTWYLRNNKHVSFGFWVFFYIPVYVFLSLSAIPLFWISWDILSISGAAFSLWFFQACFGYLLLRINVENRSWLILYAVLFPFYWITFPIYLLYSKL